MTPRNIVAQNLTRFRQESRLTREELADLALLNGDDYWYGRAERISPTVDEVGALSQALQLELQSLFRPHAEASHDIQKDGYTVRA